MEMQVSRSLKAMKARKVMRHLFFFSRLEPCSFFKLYRGDKILGIHSADRYITF